MLDLANEKVSYYSADDIMLIALDLLDDGEVDEAMSACQKGLDQHPGDESLEMLEAKILVRMKRYEEADRLLTGKVDEDSPFGICIRFAIELATGDQQQAFDKLYQCLVDEKILILEYVQIIDEQFDLLPHRLVAQEVKRAAKYLEQREQKPSEQDAEALGRIGAFLMDCNCHEEAIPVLERALDYDAYDIYSWQDLARCQFEAQKLDDCRQTCEMGLAVDPENPLLNFMLGCIQCHNKEFAEAIEHLEIMRNFDNGKLKHDGVILDRQELEQNVTFTYEMLATCYIATNNPEKALECYEALANRTPNNPDVYMHMATLELDRGNINDAIDQIDKAIRLSPDNRGYRAFRVTMYTQLKRYDEAIADLNYVLSLGGQQKTILMAKGELCRSLNRLDEAEEAYRQLLKLNPTDHVTREMMRAFFESIGDFETAEGIGG